MNTSISPPQIIRNSFHKKEWELCHYKEPKYSLILRCPEKDSEGNRNHKVGDGL